MEKNPQNEIKKITSIQHDLPRGRTLIEGSDSPLFLSNDLKEQMALYLLINPDTSEETGDVWIILTEQGKKNIIWFSLRKTLERQGYKVSVKDIDSALIRALYEKNEGVSSEKTGDNELLKYFEQMIGDAIKEKVSDIHIEKKRNSALIRMRKHGILLEYRDISPDYASSLCSVIYNVLAEDKQVQYQEANFQAAAINRVVNGVEVKLRYQSLPTQAGFDVVLRVLPIGSDDESFENLESLGYSGTQVKDIIDIVSRPVGALIIAGTTGSGKSTTLKNLLMFVNASQGYRCKIFTIEDPPEYKIPRVSQIPVIRHEKDKDSTRSPFYDPLVATMRADPDILMIGEIRDQFTGDGLKKATQSGHQVLTTVHAASGLGIVERLDDFGINPSVMGSPDFLNGLIYQKLVPILCPKCSISFNSLIEKGDVSKEIVDLSKRIEDVADFSKDTIKIKKDGGCSHCKNMGIIGREVCAEVISPDFTMKNFFREKDPVGAYTYWRSLSDGRTDSLNMTGKTALEHAITKMRTGKVSPLDIEHNFGPVNDALRKLRQMKQQSIEHEEQENKGNNQSSSIQEEFDNPLADGWKDISF